MRVESSGAKKPVTMNTEGRTDEDPALGTARYLSIFQAVMLREESLRVHVKKDPTFYILHHPHPLQKMDSIKSIEG